MFKYCLKKVLLLFLCVLLINYGTVFADNFFANGDSVVVGSAPNSINKSVSQSAGTTYLQNQYTGPGTLPNSSNYLGSSPIQTTATYNSNNQALAMVDNNGVSNTRPIVKNITSPAQHNLEVSTSRGDVQIITNGVQAGVDNFNTSDNGPVVKEITSPKAGGENSDIANATIVNGQYYNNSSGSVQGNYIPSYYTNGGNTVTDNSYFYNTDVIIYQVNDNIQAVKPSVKAPGAVVVNATTRQIYFSKGGFTSFAPASLANLVTAYILLSNKNLDDVLSVSATACTGLESGATTAGLKAGDVITVRDAIGAMFVKSCCDVSNVVAENVAGSILGFVALMNQTVKDWGCVGTNFVNPTGLNSDAQVSNTYDMAIIMDKVTQNPTLKTMLGLSSYSLPATSHRSAKTLKSSNEILTPGTSNYYTGIGASRMGYTSKAKYTIASEIDYNGQRLIAIVLKANGSQFTDTTKLLNYAKVACIEVGGINNNVNYNSNSITNVNTNINNLNYNINAGNNQTINVNNGDTIGNWGKDNNGWYFIKANGTKANNEWIKQNGKMYCVDSTGYMITGWREFSNGKLYYFDPSNGEFRYNTWVNVSTGAYYLQSDGSLAQATKGTTKNIVTPVGTYTIDDTGKAIAKIN